MNKIDRRLLKTRLLVYAIADTPSKTEYQYIVGSNPSGAFNGATPNSIAYYENEKWNFIPPQTDGLEVFCINNKELLRWNGSSWDSEMSFNVPEEHLYTFYHILTQEEIDNKSFDIDLFNSDDYKYQYEALFLNGVLQQPRFLTNGETEADFDFTNYSRVPYFVKLKKLTVEWREGFNNLDIRAGDIVVLQLLGTYSSK